MEVDEKRIMEERIARIMLRHNLGFTFFDDKDLNILVQKANPNIQV